MINGRLLAAVGTLALSLAVAAPATSQDVCPGVPPVGQLRAALDQLGDQRAYWADHVTVSAMDDGTYVVVDGDGAQPIPLGATQAIDYVVGLLRERGSSSASVRLRGMQREDAERFMGSVRRRQPEGTPGVGFLDTLATPPDYCTLFDSAVSITTDAQTIVAAVGSAAARSHGGAPGLRAEVQLTLPRSTARAALARMRTGLAQRLSSWADRWRGRQDRPDVIAASLRSEALEIGRANSVSSISVLVRLRITALDMYFTLRGVARPRHAST